MALVTSSDALVTSSVALVSTSKVPAPLTQLSYKPVTGTPKETKQGHVLRKKRMGRSRCRSPVPSLLLVLRHAGYDMDRSSRIKCRRLAADFFCRKRIVLVFRGLPRGDLECFNGGSSGQVLLKCSSVAGL